MLRAARFGIFFRHEEAPKKEAKRRWSRRDGLAKQVKGQPCDDFAQMPLRVFISAAFFRSLPSGYPSAVFASPHVRVCFTGKWIGLLLFGFAPDTVILGDFLPPVRLGQDAIDMFDGDLARNARILRWEGGV
ncbi:MAG: hypothetical protein ACI9TH_001540 [Kiritimatiellia bacterium]